MKRLTLFLLLMIVLGPLHAQKHEIGADIGIGRVFQLDFIQKQNFWQNTLGCMKYDLSYSFIAAKHFAVSAGLYFQKDGFGDSYMNFLGLPLGIDVIAGNKVQGIFGIGLKLTYLAGNLGNIYNTDMVNYRTDFQLGMYLEAGIKVYVSKHSAVLLRTTFDTDLTPLYWETDPSSHSDVVGKADVLYSDLVLSLGYRYTF